MLSLVTAFLVAVASEAFEVGEPLNHRLSVCTTEAAAIAIIQIDREQGREAGIKAWDASPDCGLRFISGYRLGYAVYAANLPRAEGKTTVTVVEILEPGSGLPVAYLVTTLPVRVRAWLWGLYNGRRRPAWRSGGYPRPALPKPVFAEDLSLLIRHPKRTRARRGRVRPHILH